MHTFTIIFFFSRNFGGHGKEKRESLDGQKLMVDDPFPFTKNRCLNFDDRIGTLFGKKNWGFR